MFTESVEKVDFSDAEQRREEINAFVEEVTQSHIKDLLAPGSISPATKLVLTNAAFFKGFWATKFDKKDTETKTFNGATKGGVEMMHVKGSFNYGSSMILSITHWILSIFYIFPICLFMNT